MINFRWKGLAACPTFNACGPLQNSFIVDKVLLVVFWILESLEVWRLVLNIIVLAFFSDRTLFIFKATFLLFCQVKYTIF